MKARKKARVNKIAKMILEMVRDGMRGLPQEEQERRLKSFCDDAEDRLRTEAKASGSAQPAERRISARGRA